MRTCVRFVRRAPLPLRLLVPRRRVAAGGARGGRGRAGARHPRADRPQHGLGLDGVRGGGRGARVEGDPRGGGRRGGARSRARRAQPRGGPSPDAAGGRRGGLAQPVPDPHARARAHARWVLGAADRGPAGRAARVRGGARGRAGLPERLRHPRHARRAGASPPARRLRARQPAGRAPAPVPALRPRAQPAAGRAGGAARGAVRGDRRRPRPRPGARAAAGRVRGPAPPHGARCVGADAARQLRARPGLAGRDGGTLRGPSRRGGRVARAGRKAHVRPEG